MDSVAEHPFPEGAFDPPVLTAVAGLLRSVWDPNGRILRAAARTDDPAQPDAPRTYEDFARVLCGILAAGGNLADISGYLRREEERLLGSEQTTGRERWAVGRGAGEAMGKVFRKRQHPA